MTDCVYLNGDFLPAAEAKVSIFDRGFLFGDGVYEVIPVLDGRLVQRAYFLERLRNSLAAVGLDWPCPPDRLLEILETLVERNHLREGSLYLQVTRGAAERAFAFPEGVQPTLVAWARAHGLIANPLADTGVSVATVEDLRWKRRDIKSVNLLAQCLAKEEARRRGAFEAWMVEDGLVTEGASSTAYLVKSDRVITRALSRAVLPGIRRRVLLEAAGRFGLEVEPRAFSVAEALAADEACLSSATTFVLPVTRIDDQPVGEGKPGPITRRLREIYIELAREEARSDRSRAR